MIGKRTSLLATGLVAIALAAVGASDASAWVRKNLRDQPGRSNLNLHVTGGRMAFEVERGGSSTIEGNTWRAAIDGAMQTLSSVHATSVQITDAGSFDMAAPIHSRDGLKQNGKNQIYFFHSSDPAFPAVAVTAFFYDTASGAITEADIALNEADYRFSVATPDDPNQPLGSKTADLQEVVTHELMHALGFEHSAVAGRFDAQTGREVAGYTSHDFSLHATVFPIASQTVQGRSLSEDDMAGLRAMYGSGYGTLRGRVVDGATGRGVKGAHVVAVSPDAVDVPIAATISGTGDASGSGEFVLAGLPPGSYMLRIEPLSGGSNPFVGAYTSYTNFDTSFDPEFYSGPAESSHDAAIESTDAVTLSVAAGGDTGSIVFVTNATPPAPTVSSASFNGKKLKVVGAGFAVGETEFELDGVRYTNVKIVMRTVGSNGMATRFSSKDPDLSTMLRPGTARSLVVINVETGQRSAPIPVVP